MINAIGLYPTSMEPEKIEELLSKQIDSMKKADGLISIKTSEGNLLSPSGPPSFAKVLETNWSSLEALMAWVQNQTPEENANKDYMLENGVVLLFYEVTEHNWPNI